MMQTTMMFVILSILGLINSSWGADSSSDTTISTNNVRHRKEQVAQPTIKGLRWVDADLDKPLKCDYLQGGYCWLFRDQNWISTDEGDNLVVEAVTEGPVKSVRFQFSGDNGPLLDRIENSPAWAMCGNAGSDFFPCPASIRYGYLTVTAYSGPGGTGTASEAFSTLIIFYTPGAPELFLTLIDADTDSDVQNLENGTVISLSRTPRINVRLDDQPVSRGWQPQGVEFVYDTNVIVRNETKRPYAFYGNNGADYAPFTPTLGNHTLRANAYKPPGKFGASYMVWFTVVE